MRQINVVRTGAATLVGLVLVVKGGGWALGQTAPAAPQTPPPATAPARATPPTVPVPPPQPGVGHPQVAPGPTYEELVRQAEAQIAPQIQAAHGIDAWAQKSLLQAGISLEWPGQPAAKGKLTLETHGKRYRFEMDGGGSLVCDGEKLWSTLKPQDWNRTPRLRDVRAFVLVPFLLRETTTHLTTYKVVVLKGTSNHQFIVTFDIDKTPWPVEWCVMYADHTTKRMRALAYKEPTPENSPVDTAEAFAAMFDDYSTIDGVTLPGSFTLWNWSPDRGIIGDSLGNGKLTDIKFLPADEKVFEKPADAKERMMSVPAGH